MNNLTTNQVQIADAIATGRTVKEVADHLNKRPQTVFNTLAKIYERLNIPHNASALAVWRICTLNNIELPEFIRKAGAMVLLLLFSTTLHIHDDTIYRRGRRNRTEELLEEVRLKES